MLEEALDSLRSLTISGDLLTCCPHVLQQLDLSHDRSMHVMSQLLQAAGQSSGCSLASFGTPVPVHCFESRAATCRVAFHGIAWLY